jgi:hypothetical protein
MGMSSKHASTRQHRGISEAPARYKTTPDQPHSLADALFTTTQQRVLGALYGQHYQANPAAPIHRLPPRRMRGEAQAASAFAHHPARSAVLSFAKAGIQRL